MTRRIDTHHHFWQYSAEQYPWIAESMSVLRRDFLPKHLQTETLAAGVDGVISVQARQTVEESTWLLELAAKQDWIMGVVGWLPLASPEVRTTMESFRGQSKLVGLRHVVQDEQDDGFLERPAFNEGVSHIKDFGWTYDLLIYAKQLPATIKFVDRHPNQVFVLDHIAKPTIRSEEFHEQWARDIRDLAKRANAFCKFSGVPTEVRDHTWSATHIQRYWDTVLEAFGADRLMFGSDWPVCLLKTGYEQWVSAVVELTSQLSINEQASFWSQNARRAYSLKN
jgi:L-fuconolactonase